MPTNDVISLFENVWLITTYLLQKSTKSQVHKATPPAVFQIQFSAAEQKSRSISSRPVSQNRPLPPQASSNSVTTGRPKKNETKSYSEPRRPKTGKKISSSNKRPWRILLSFATSKLKTCRHPGDPSVSLARWPDEMARGWVSKRVRELQSAEAGARAASWTRKKLLNMIFFSSEIEQFIKPKRCGQNILVTSFESDIGLS